MDDIMDRVLFGFDKKNEIFNLWYEIHFLRIVVNRLLELNPTLHENFSQEDQNKAREMAQELVTKRFPNMKINFNKPEPDSPSEDQKEAPACTPEDQKEEPASCHLPSNEP